jgi:hypothetical protein
LFGEVCFCEITAANQGTQTDPPTVLFKVGNGKDYFKDLNWASALAADVYDWAKLSWSDFVKKFEAGAELGVSVEDGNITYSHESKLGKSYTTLVPDDGDKSATAFGDSVTIKVPKLTVNEYGHITAAEDTEYTVSIPALTIPDSPSITIVDKTNTDDDNTVYAVTNLEESGTLNHTITPTYKAVPTQKYVDEKIAAAVAGAVDYLGVVNNADELSAAAEKATHGDFVRVATAFDDYHVGDLLIYHKPEGAETATWVVIHGEEGDIVEVEAGNGLAGGGSTGKVTLSIAEKGVTEGMLEQGVQDALGLARAAATDASNKAAVVLSEAQKYTDDKIDGLHAIATSGSIYDVEEHNVDDNGVTYFVLDCNW